MHNINTRIEDITPLLSPDMLLHTMPVSDTGCALIQKSREAIGRIIHGQDQRFLVVVGPCSIHDEKAALEYATRLKQLSQELEEHLLIVMRVYFEKPRTTVGWKGLINDPHLDESFAINDGLLLARKILLSINNIGLATATEFVDTITPQYVADLISWVAIGARTTESQPHRMLASGLSMPVGFKNNTAGNISSAVNAAASASQPHRFLGVTEQGLGAIVVTRGNKDAHVILRGGDKGPNYHPNHLAEAVTLLKEKSLSSQMIIDCSHDNSEKDHTKQRLVIDSVIEHIHQKNCPIMGVMIESHLHAGKQAFGPKETLTYGQSITDACINWEETEIILRDLASACQAR